ncbi:hypothetical protein O181_026703 [Austropuccinia psidii MF-1]|uniref:Uncharacterized protein n=1 Tax=Austropuccinia psidii MF-1 TaxID=1389203 RepID=A0A9Q3CQB2_9BASI|nr:hypothetical protein [Austropuccinia psidii MF-1]
MSQFAEKTQKQFAEPQASHERMKTLAASMDKIFKTLQEGHAKLTKVSEEKNKRLNQVLEEQHHSKRDRDCLDQDINKLFNVYHNRKPQPKGHVVDTAYHQEDIKPDAILVNKPRSPSKYQDGENMSYCEKETLKQLPKASGWPKFSGTGEYDLMELIHYIDGLFIDVPSIPYYWITARLKTAFKGHASIWYTEMKEINGRRNWPWWKSQVIQNYSNATWIWHKTIQSKRLKAIDPQMNTQMSNHKLLKQTPGELEHAVKCRSNQIGTPDDISKTLQDLRKRKNIGKYSPHKSNHYASKFPKAKKIYAIEKVPEEEFPTEDSESDSMGDAIREQSDEKRPKRGIPSTVPRGNTTRNSGNSVRSRHATRHCKKIFCKNTQDEQTFLVTQTRGMAYIHGTATKMTVCVDNA